MNILTFLAYFAGFLVTCAGTLFFVWVLVLAYEQFMDWLWGQL